MQSPETRDNKTHMNPSRLLETGDIAGHVFDSFEATNMYQTPTEET